MATHESWQFSFVQESGEDIKPLINLGSKSPLFVEYSNLVVGSVPSELQPTEVVSGDHVRVYWSIPSNMPTHNIQGEVKILRKPGEFPRSLLDSEAEVILSEDFSTTLQSINRDEYFLHLDHLDVKQMVYYTIFYKVTNISSNQNTWSYSSINGHDRAFSLSSGDSIFGDQMYNYMPIGVRNQDKEYADLTLKKFLQILGKPFDEIKERINEKRKNHFSLDRTDASLIPYIDHFLGWPTNFELKETRRREETSNIISLWKNKGQGDALELFFQNLVGWDIEIVEARNYYITTATSEDRLVANEPPIGWDNNGPEGSWEDQISEVPFNGTLSFPKFVLQNGIRDTHRVISDLSSKGWKNTFDGFIQLKTQIQSEQPLVSALAAQKIMRLLPYLKIYYTDFDIMVTDQYTDGVSIELSTTFGDDSHRPESDLGLLLCNESFVDTGPPTFYTYSNLYNKSYLWSPADPVPHRTYHSHLGLQ